MKLGWYIDNQERAYQHPDSFVRERTRGWQQRLAIGPSGNHVELILNLTDALEDPFFVLYVLVVSRGAGVPGRYQSERLTRAEMRGFVDSFRGLFENDGRAHVWIASVDDRGIARGTLVYDNHNIIYGYGPLRHFERICLERGLSKARHLNIPCPHSHHYNPDLDPDVERLLDYWSWRWSKLREEDDPR